MSTHAHTPIERKVPDSVKHHAGCGCEFTCNLQGIMGKRWTIAYCSLHAQAPAMLEALKAMVEAFHIVPRATFTKTGLAAADKAMDQANALLAQIEGKE